MNAWPLLVLLAVELFCGVVLTRLSLRESLHGFSGYDVSPMIDAGWRVLQGQVPGRDFIATFPPSLYLLVALSFHWFGLTWMALARSAVWIYGLLLLLGWRLMFVARHALSVEAAAALSLAWFIGQSILLISLNYPWHASMAQQFAMYALFAAALCSSKKLSSLLKLECWLHLTIASAVLLLSKPNTAYLAILLWLPLLGCKQRAWRQCLVSLLASVLLAGVALAVVHVSLWSMLGSYMGLTGRLLPKAFANGILYTLYARYGLANLLTYAVLAPAVATALVLAWKKKSVVWSDAIALLGLGALLISIVGMGTNFDYKLTDSPLCLLGLTLFWISAPGAVNQLGRQALAAGVMLLFVAVFYGRTRLRMQTIGTWADDKCGPTAPTGDRFLRNVEVCAEVQTALTTVDTTLQTAGTDNVFFGPALEFLYADHKLRSPAGLPNWWDPGTSFPKRDASRIATAWAQDNFQLLFFANSEDRIQMPQAISNQIDRDYQLVLKTPELHVYKQRYPPNTLQGPQ